MNTSLGSTPNSSFRSSGRDSLRARYSSMNSQPSIRSFFTCFWIFGAFRHMPSAMTRHAPPRIRFVSIRGRSMSADLRVLRSFPVDRHRAVRHDQRDFLVGGRVLEMLSLAVQRDLLLESLDLFSCRNVASEAELPPHDVRDQNAQGLPGPSGRANRTRVREIDVRRAVAVPLDLDPGEPFERRNKNSLSQ